VALSIPEIFVLNIMPQKRYAAEQIAQANKSNTLAYAHLERENFRNYRYHPFQTTFVWIEDDDCLPHNETSSSEGEHVIGQIAI
jgi:hypothetical protein